jgi:hypothetical protein
VLGTISRKTSDSTDKFNGQNPLDIAIANAFELLRGQNFENWPRGDPRATRHAKYEQKYGQNEHLARANKAPDGPNRSPARKPMPVLLLKRGTSVTTNGRR